MAFAATSLGSGRAYSIGPVKQQTLAITAVSGDTSGVVSAVNFDLIDEVLVDGGMRLTAAPTINNAVTPPTATLAFVDPSTGGYFGTVTIRGK